MLFYCQHFIMFIFSIYLYLSFSYSQHFHSLRCRWTHKTFMKQQTLTLSKSFIFFLKRIFQILDLNPTVDHVSNMKTYKATMTVIWFNRLPHLALTEWFRTVIFSGALNRSSSHRCEFEPLASSGHMWDKPSSACGWSGGFSRGSPVFAPHYDWLKPIS